MCLSPLWLLIISAYWIYSITEVLHKLTEEVCDFWYVNYYRIVIYILRLIKNAYGEGGGVSNLHTDVHIYEREGIEMFPGWKWKKNNNVLHGLF